MPESNFSEREVNLERERTGKSAETEEWTRATAGLKGAMIAGGLAGWFLAITQMAASVSVGQGALMPWRKAASVLIGESALETTGPVVVLIVGLVVHLSLSAVFGIAYSLATERLFGEEWRTHFEKQAASGALFGLLLYVINFQVLSRLLYPWMLESSQAWQVALHLAAFGVPMGLLAASLERRLPSFAHRTTADVNPPKNARRRSQR